MRAIAASRSARKRHPALISHIAVERRLRGELQYVDLQGPAVGAIAAHALKEPAHHDRPATPGPCPRSGQVPPRRLGSPRAERIDSGSRCRA